MRLTGRDEIGGNRSAGGAFLSFLFFFTLARRQAGIFKGSCGSASRLAFQPRPSRR